MLASAGTTVGVITGFFCELLRDSTIDPSAYAGEIQIFIITTFPVK
jgi:hypothetical protein